MRALIVAAALLGLLLVAAGAAGGHSMVPSDAAARWQGAFLYGFAHTLAAMIAAILPFHNLLQYAAGWAFVLSVPLFSGVQIGKIMLGGIATTPTPLDSVSFLVPVGGVAFISGWLLLGLSAIIARR
ncbi:MAG: hypothetical protein RIR33_146 [Pseudomonadota bacterium]|jgi:uncharacterized membrane protein YgdD (TMEM256/DUF423 family)